MIAIETKYLPATNTRGSRIKAFTCNNDNITMPFDCSLSTLSAHFEVAKALMKTHYKAVSDSDIENMRYGSTKSGYVFCFDQSKVSNIT